MKTAVISMLLLSSICIVNAQTIYATYNPDKKAPGVIAELPILSTTSIVFSFEHGTYRFASDKCTVAKYGVGIKYKWLAAITHYNNFSYSETTFFEMSKTKKYSVEIGFLPQHTTHFITGVLYDILNNEARVSIGWKF